MTSIIADATLAGRGKESYDWAYKHMGTLSKTIDTASSQVNFHGVKIGVCLHITKETSVLVMGLKRLGADVYLAGANPLSTQNEIAAFLASEGITVYAWRGQSSSEYQECIRNVLRGSPKIIIDDGSDCHITAHDEKEFVTQEYFGGTEETTTGVVRLRALEASGKLKYPIIAVNNAYTKQLFDNRYGTGQSTFDGILRATSLLIAGKRVVVSGYGWVGKGIAMRARGLGALVSVTEIDPVRALEARMDGYDIRPMGELSREGDLFITATGQKHVISKEHFAKMKNGAILANAGHFDIEIDVSGLEIISKERKTVRNHVEKFTLDDERAIYLIASGRIVNLVAAEGHPPEVMALSFSNQLLAAARIFEKHEEFQNKLIDVPTDIDELVANNALEAMNIRIDSPTEEQRAYGGSWRL